MGWGRPGNWGNMMNGWGYSGYGIGGYWWMGIIGIVIHFIIVVGLIFLALHLFRRYSLQSRQGGIGRQASGLDILRERYARGEIDSEEYQSIKRDLESK